MERVSVVIPNWNGEKFLTLCLKALRSQTYRDFAAYVVDNGSNDDSIDLIEREFPEVKIIRFPLNRGFSAAVNAGIKASAGDYIVLLNNDTEVDVSWLEELVSVLDTRDEIGFCASKILDFKDRTVIDSVGDSYSRLGIAFKVGSRETDNGQYEQSVEVFSASAAASIYRRTLFDEIGFFDEDFFAYMEDMDIGIRARLAGYRCLFVPTAKVFHIGSASSGGDMSVFSLRLTVKNIYNIIIKDMPLRILIQILPATILVQLAVITRSLFTTRHSKARKNMRGYFQGILAAISDMPTMLRKRRRVQRMRRVSVREFTEMLRRGERQARESRRTAGSNDSRL